MEAIIGIQFTAYVALAVVLYALRQATGVPNRFIPLIAVILGLFFAGLEAMTFNFDVMIKGIQYALYGIGTVATIKYALEKKNIQK